MNNPTMIALAILAAGNGVGLVLAYRTGRRHGVKAAPQPARPIVVPPVPVLHEDRSRIVNWAWQSHRFPAPWLEGAEDLVRSICTRALADTGICELPYAAECLAIAGIREEMIQAGLQSWGSAWVGRVMRDVGVSAPNGYADARAWLSWARRPISGTPEPGAVILMGSRERPRVAIVIRSVPFVVIVEVLEEEMSEGNRRDLVIVARCLTPLDRVIGYIVPLAL